jgi:DNA-binding transcriptional LysR family regulator
VTARALAALTRLAAAMRSLPRGRLRGFERAEHRLTSTQIRALLSLAEGGSFLGAARATGTSQPALHRAVRELEGLCGVALCERRGQRVGLTDQGAKLARQFRLASADLLAARQDLAVSEGEGRIVIGAMPLCRALLLPRAIARMTRAHPDFRFDVAEGSYTELIEPLRDGRMEIAIGALREPCPPDLREEALFVDSLAIAARKQHPLAREGRIDRERLAQFPWIIGRAGSPLREHWERLFDGEHPPAPIECGSVMAIRGVLLESDFLTLLSPDQIALELESGMLTTLETTLPDAQRTIGVISRADWLPTLLQRRFLDLLKALGSGRDTPEIE